MILRSIYEYVENAGRIEQQQLLSHFHLTPEGLAPMIAVLLKRGKIQKTINTRGNTLSPQIFYTCTKKQQISILTVV